MINEEFKSYFKLETPGLLFPFRTIPLNHTDGFKNISYKVWNYELHETKAPTFGYKRNPGMRLHAARDLYYDINEPIYAIFDGIVKRKKLFYLDTWVIEIEHDYEYKKGYKLMVRYGEVNKNNILVNIGDKVTRGQKIAEIGLLVPYVIQPSPDKRGMLHIEMYTGEESGALSNSNVNYSDMLYAKSTNFSAGRSFKRRKDLFDPLQLLKKMYINSKKEGLIK